MSCFHLIITINESYNLLIPRGTMLKKHFEYVMFTEKTEQVSLPFRKELSQIMKM